MAPLRRRAKQEQQQQGAAITSTTTANRARQRGARASKSSGGNSEKQDQESDDDTPIFNIVSECMKFSNEYDKKHRSKSGKLVDEAKKTANEYTRTVENALLAQEKELSDTYDAFVQATLVDLQERQNILKQLSDNYVELEKIRHTLADRCLAYDKKRYAGVTQQIEKADKETSAANKQVLHAVNLRKTAFRTRNIATNRRIPLGRGNVNAQRA